MESAIVPINVNIANQNDLPVRACESRRMVVGGR
jgi:hypothetical protein